MRKDDSEIERLRKAAVWEVAWRSAITTTVAVIVAYLAAAYGLETGKKIGFESGVRACFAGHPSCTILVPSRQKEASEWLED